jgi:hypothetical protein
MKRKRSRGWWLAKGGPRQRKAQTKGGLARAVFLSPERRVEIATGAGVVAARRHRAKRLSRLVRRLRARRVRP